MSHHARYSFNRQLLNHPTPVTRSLTEFLRQAAQNPVEGKEFGEVEAYCTAVLQRRKESVRAR